MFQDLIEIIILSAIQGVSEFLPISSSAHLIIVSTLYEFHSSSILIDISLHLGSLLAIIFYFKKELFNLKENQRIISLILFGSVPIVFIGYILYTTGLINLLRDIKIIAWTTLVFAIVLYFADQSRLDKKISSDLNIKTILIIGIFQVLSLVPGVSRAGITITAARILKYSRVDASKISFLLSIPALAGASFLSLKDLSIQTINFNYLIFIAITLSFFFSYITVKYFLRFINKFSMNLFILYRIIISLVLFYIIY